MLHINAERTNEILRNAKNSSVAVIGDIMLDRFFWGNVTRISPEAPVPVVELQKETFHLGGAANVAANLKTLGLNPILLGVLGNDKSGNDFVGLCKELGMITDGLFQSTERPTTVKTRIIANNQHVARVDREIRADINAEIQNFFLNYLKSIPNLKAIIFEDYNKGMLPKEFIHKVIEFANENGIVITVDPKQDNFFEFKNVTLFKPNKKEAQTALGYALDTEENIRRAGLEMLSRLDCQNVLITLGSQGMMLFQQDGNIFSVPTRARQVADVSGAGDTAIASFTAAYLGGGTSAEASSVANFASGTVCEKPGVVPINITDLLAAIIRNGNNL
jgi:rfaE bifunctional protein kinase chain/domain